MQLVTGIGRREFPLTYLGCPIFYSRRNMSFYSDLIQKVLGKLQSLKGKLLSYGGRVVLISHHLLSAVDPPDYVIEKLHKIFAQFFWCNTVGDRSFYHHQLGIPPQWLELCLPQNEGGLGFRSLFNVSKALLAKLWWNFRTKPSMWSAFMSSKYSKKINLVIVQWKEGSHVWRKMLEVRDLIEHQIFWKLRMGSSQFWFNNWTGL